MRVKLFLITALAALLAAGPSFAGDVVTFARGSVNQDVSCITIDWTADAAGAITPTVISDAAGVTLTINGWVFEVVTLPGATAPDDYTLTLTDKDGRDMLTAQGANRSVSAAESIVPLLAGTAHYGAKFVDGHLIFAVTDNATNAAKGQVRIYYHPRR